MTDWKNPKIEKPPQGKKILLFYKGDCWVGIRIQEAYIPIPFSDSKYARIDEPDLWADVEMPGSYTGKTSVLIDGEMLDFDEIEKKHPEILQEMKNNIIETIPNKTVKN